ncbi:MAG: universal stress protein [Planctomycetes bacterium]|nr:universal stress protein [Planctomycetota bacterium]
MKGFRRVLVCLDFGPASRRVLEAGVDVAESGAAVRLLHVVAWVPSVVEGAMAGYGSARAIRTLHADSERQLGDWGRTVVGVDLSTAVVEGQPAGTILDVAEEWDADAIVVGQRRRGRFAALRPGSVVERVLRGARCPVLVVPV